MKIPRLRAVALVALLLLVFGGLYARRHRERPSELRLERYKAELRQQGEQLTFADLGYPRSPVDLEEYFAFTNRVRSLAAQYLRPGSLEVMKIIATGRAQVAWRQPEVPLSGGKGAGPGIKGVTWEEVGRDLERVEGELRGVRDFLREPQPYLVANPDADPYAPKNDFVAKRTAAHWLQAAVVNNLHCGESALALENLGALWSLARLHEDELILVNQMIRVAIAGLATATTWEALQYDGWGEEELAMLQGHLDSPDLIEALERGFVGERSHCGYWIQKFVEKDPSAVGMGFTVGASSATDLAERYLVGPMWRMSWRWEDERFALERAQGVLRAIRLGRSGLPWPRVREKLQAEAAAFGQLDRWLDRYRYAVSLITIPSGVRAAESAVRNQTALEMCRVVVALKRHRLRHGAWPESLAGLTPEFLGQVPRDWFDGQSLRYRLNEDGTWLLYSVGTDGVDDNGDAEGSNGDHWKGRDTVWPTAADAPH